ncbi:MULTISPECIES: hypothetical protein [unclassified Streptomyces]|uniref:hypothetical protein n=1 Tax=unclassified Streptomyces TaxID=2593676 RepID=UPI002E125FE0|nr:MULTISPECIES: hypothetical protein [unclassified Streptomyces]WSR23682.1 hypothetical protein OG573_34470 [Streptomyces sp. NBC_01205]
MTRFFGIKGKAVTHYVVTAHPEKIFRLPRRPRQVAHRLIWLADVHRAIGQESA